MSQDIEEVDSTGKEASAVEVLAADGAVINEKTTSAPLTPTIDIANKKGSIGAHDTLAAVSTQLDGVQELLARAAVRQKTFEELRENADEIGVRDTRRFDHPIEPVHRIPSGRRGRRGSATLSLLARGNAGVHGSAHVASTPDISSANTSTELSVVDQPPWRVHLEVHIGQLLRELTLRPRELQILLAAHYPNGEGSYDGGASDEDDAGSSHGGSKTSAAARYAHSASKCLGVAYVYKKLTEIGIHLGEVVYQRIRCLLQRSVSNGVIDREANAVRLESMFKLELRRQVTIESIYEVVMTRQALYLSRKRARSQNSPTTVPTPSGEVESLVAIKTNDKARAFEPSPEDPTEITSAHHFKMQALERVLALSQRGQSLTTVEVIVPIEPLSDQLDDQLQEKLTAVIYNKNRDSFPFWRESPENGMTRDETTKVLRTVIEVLMGVPTLRNLTIDQLIEVARITKWKAFGQGDVLCKQHTLMDQLLIVMEGKVGYVSYNEGITDAIPLDVEEPSEHPPDSCRPYFGQLGLLTKSEMWPMWLRVVSTHAKVLTLSREMFDIALTKFFGGRKSLSSQRDPNASKRPTSSSATIPAPRPMFGSGRPSTAAAREKAITEFRKFREGHTMQTEGCVAKPAVAILGHAAVSVECETDQQREVAGNVHKLMTARIGSKKMYQHYPNFAIPSTSTGGSQCFRLKCTHPIAFGLRSVDDLIEEEWAPAFPDASSHIDYLSAADSSLLYEKRNVLIKSNLRMVCTNVPFQDESNRGVADDLMGVNQEPFGEFNSGDSQLNVAGTAAFVTTSGINSAATPIAFGADGELMTLGQFAEARRRMFGRSGTASSGNSPTMRNIMTSVATSAILAKNGHSPFTSSSFVPETSFIDDLRFVQVDETDVEETDDNLTTRRIPINANTNQPVPEMDEEDDEDAESVGHNTSAADIGVTESTRARKMALDSLVQTMAAGSQSTKVEDQEAARRVILQKHLLDASSGSALRKPANLTPRKSSSVSTTGARQPMNAESHAPLPLRADLQRRMESVLGSLKMKPKAKLDLVLKYTHADFYDLFPDAVVLWEQALHYITKREKALDALRKFELVASDPRRHFRSLSTHRLTEQKERDALFYQLNYASDLCRESLDELERRCEDVVYYEHRAYREKMKKDYTELLYEVEQERLRIIYRNTHPSVSEQIDVGQEGSEGDTKSPESKLTLKQSARATPVTDDQRNAQGVVRGSHSTTQTARYSLTTPRESIYVSVTEHQWDEHEEKERERAAITAAIEMKKKGRSLSEQVKAHRQAQLEAISNKIPGANPLRSSSNAVEPANQRGVDKVELRSPTVTTVNSTNGHLHSLKEALERTLHKRR